VLPGADENDRGLGGGDGGDGPPALDRWRVQGSGFRVQGLGLRV